jgi:hypothetical protein
MSNTYDPSIFWCPFAKEQPQPIATRYPIVTSKGTFVQFWCPLCDADHHPYDDPAYRASEPGAHAARVTPSTPPPEWQSRHEEAPC